MCGIAGSINHSLNIPLLTKDLFHRGPDEQTTLTEDNLILHHHRLAILDIAGGRQPMHFEHLTIIFNGEIYNHLDVRAKYGFECKTNSDTETILRAYDKIGAKCLDDFDGMFAFVIYDRNKKELFLARDRAGKKPLYYYSDGKCFVFSSELRALNNQLPLQVNERHLQQYVRMGYFYKSFTAYKNVWEIPAGNYAYVSLQHPEVKVERWWDINDFYRQKSPDSFEAALDKTNQLLHQGVRRRIESSDLEVGSFLSGGIDSGLVTAIAKNYNPKLRTFTVSFEGSEYDEAPLAKLVADHVGTNHLPISISFDHLLDDVEEILCNYGEPFFDSSAIPSYYVSEAAKKHVTVILNGDGGDEIFGGYRRHLPFVSYDFFSPGVVVRGMAKALHTALPAANSKKSLYNYLYRFAGFAAKKGLGTYLSATLDTFDDYEKWLTGSKEALKEIEDDFDLINKSSLTGLQKIMSLDFDNILTGNLLVKMDIATMAHSLEGRSPFLCKELLEYAPTLNDKYKISGKRTKYILRTLAKKYLPDELINQPKRGFEIPLKAWVDGMLNPIIKDYIMPPDAYCRNFINSAFLDDVWNRKIKVGDEKRAKMIWTLFALEVWYKKVYGKK